MGDEQGHSCPLFPVMNARVVSVFLLALQGDLELIDKIIELEMNPKSEEEKEEEEEEEDSVGMSYVRSFFTSGRVPFGRGQRMKQTKVKARGWLGSPLPLSYSPPSSRLSLGAPSKQARQMKHDTGRKQSGTPPAAALSGVRRSSRKRHPVAVGMAPPSKKANTSRHKTTAKTTSTAKASAVGGIRSTAPKTTGLTTAKAAPARIAKRTISSAKLKGKSGPKRKTATRSTKRLQQLSKTTQG